VLGADSASPSFATSVGAAAKISTSAPTVSNTQRGDKTPTQSQRRGWVGYRERAGQGREEGDNWKERTGHAE